MITKIKDYEYEVVDPVSKGTWKVIASHPLSDEGVMSAISKILLTENKRPKEGSTLTVIFSIKVKGD